MKMMSVEKKLALAKSLREDQARNMGLIKRREDLVSEEVVIQNQEQSQNNVGVSSLKIRFFLAVLLGAGFFYMQKNEVILYGIDATYIAEHIDSEGMIQNMIFEIEEMLHMWYNEINL